jgi:hypothetical protein
MRVMFVIAMTNRQASGNVEAGANRLKNRAQPGRLRFCIGNKVPGVPSPIVNSLAAAIVDLLFRERKFKVMVMNGHVDRAAVGTGISDPVVGRIHNVVTFIVPPYFYSFPDSVWGGIVRVFHPSARSIRPSGS